MGLIRLAECGIVLCTAAAGLQLVEYIVVSQLRCVIWCIVFSCVLYYCITSPTIIISSAMTNVKYTDMLFRHLPPR